MSGLARDLPRIAVTMGDPAGIGPELMLRLLADEDLARDCVPVIFGDATVLRQVAGRLGWAWTAPVLSRAEWSTRAATLTGPTVLDLEIVGEPPVTPGQVAARCGEAAYRYVVAAIEAGLAGEVAAISTGPLNKEALHAAGHDYPGHTEIFAERLKAERSCMMLTSPELTCALVTTHVGLWEVPGLLTVEGIVEVIELTAEAMGRILERKPRLAACGLNPHAGEGGLFGRGEEEKIIRPALEQARARGIAIEGPWAPDTAFLPQRRAVIDAYVCMYHDQGLIPLKTLAFDSGINVTLGLPVPRTSVDHGTAFDIAWQGTASVRSLVAAVRLAGRLARG